MPEVIEQATGSIFVDATISYSGGWRASELGSVQPLISPRYSWLHNAWECPVSWPDTTHAACRTQDYTYSETWGAKHVASGQMHASLVVLKLSTVLSKHADLQAGPWLDSCPFLQLDGCGLRPRYSSLGTGGACVGDLIQRRAGFQWAASCEQPSRRSCTCLGSWSLPQLWWTGEPLILQSWFAVEWVCNA